MFRPAAFADENGARGAGPSDLISTIAACVMPTTSRPSGKEEVNAASRISASRGTLPRGGPAGKIKSGIQPGGTPDRPDEGRRLSPGSEGIRRYPALAAAKKRNGANHHSMSRMRCWGGEPPVRPTCQAGCQRIQPGSTSCRRGAAHMRWQPEWGGGGGAQRLSNARHGIPPTVGNWSFSPRRKPGLQHNRRILPFRSHCHYSRSRTARAP